MNTDILTLIRSGKRIVCFGAYKTLKGCCDTHKDLDFITHIYRILDNAVTQFEWEGNILPVHKLDGFVKEHIDLNNIAFLITCNAYTEVLDQLQRVRQLKDVECYIYPLVEQRPLSYEFPKHKNGAVQKIPKKIHYFWFGGNEIPEKNRIWMESWKRYCPDYEIIRWDESNYDYKKNEYMYDAYKHQKWGFVPDYARLDLIYRYGGVYFDTDVEIIRNIDDLLCDDAFCGFESRHYVNIGSGFGAVAGFPLIEVLRDTYEKAAFVSKDGSLNLTTSPQYQTKVLCELGLELNNTMQVIQGMRIYPSDVLSPLCLITHMRNLTDNTHSIHHFSASWFDDIQREKKEEQQKKHAVLADEIEKNNNG
jgi:hypothetical protein